MRRTQIRLGLLVTIFAAIAALVYWRFPDTAVTQEDQQAAESIRRIFDFSRTTDTTPIPITVGTIEMVIPANYFRGTPVPNERTRATLLQALLPDFDPYTARNAEEFQRPGWNRKISILIQEVRSQEPDVAQRIIYVGVDSLEPLEEIGTVFGLKHFQGPNLNGSRQIRDVFIPYNEDSDFTIICRIQNSVPHPSCQIVFIRDGYFAKLTFSREYLNQYSSILNNSYDLIENFIVNSPTEM